MIHKHSSILYSPEDSGGGGGGNGSSPPPPADSGATTGSSTPQSIPSAPPPASDSSKFVTLATQFRTQQGGSVTKPIDVIDPNRRPPAKVLEKDLTDDGAPLDDVPDNRFAPEPPKPVTPEPKKPVVPAPAPAPELDGLDETDRKILSQMSKAARAIFIQRAKDLNALKAKHEELAKQRGLPDSYLNHPEAYTLSPEYAENMQSLQTISNEEQYWEEQLLKVKANQEWVDLEGYDKDGNPIFSEPKPASPTAELVLSKRLNRASSMRDQYAKVVNDLKEGFKGRYESAVQNLNSYRAESFAWVKDPKKLDEIVVDMGKEGKIPVKAIREALLGQMSPHFRSHPLAEAVGDLYAALHLYGETIRNQAARLSLYENNIKDQSFAEPSGKKVVRNDTSELEFSTDGMPSE